MKAKVPQDGGTTSPRHRLNKLDLEWTVAVRANWKGYLKLSLVSCAVALFPASSTKERISFHNVNRATGNRLRQQIVDEATGEVVEPENRVKGYEVERGEYVILTDEELDAVEIESTHTIAIERFVPRAEIDELYFDSPYYLAPNDAVAGEAFAVIREAMRRRDMIAIGRVVLFKRERIIMIEPRGKGLLARLLHYNYEVRDAGAYFDDIADLDIPGEMLNLALHIIDTKAGHFEPATFEDRYQTALTELIKAKQAGHVLPAPVEARPSNVVNLLDALRRSVEAEGKGDALKGKPARRSASPQRRESGPVPNKTRRLRKAG